jgi:nicotinic acid mononucleotide adenylyltransferase
MVIVVDRPGHPLDTDLVARSGVPAGKFLFLHPEVLDIQSEDVRARLTSGRGAAGRVPLMVRRYIREHGLYRK